MNFNESNKARNGERLDFGYWSFPGAWILELGAFGRDRLS
jgi:hypothetical protein